MEPAARLAGPGGPPPPSRRRAFSRRTASRFALTIPLEDLGCAALFVFFAMQGSIPGIAPGQALELTASPPTGLTTIGGIATQALANAFIVALLLRSPRRVLREILSLRWAALLALLATLSAAWSLDPWVTLRRSIPFALAGLFGIYFASRFSVQRQLSILRTAMLAVTLATVAMVICAPATGLDHSAGHLADWQGVFTQKNACGRMMVLAMVVVLFGDRLTLRRIAGLGLFALVLAMSGSRAAWLVAAAMVLLRVFVQFTKHAPPRQPRIVMAAAAIVLTAAGAAAIRWLPQFVSMLGRDATLSGRTAIWAQIAPFVAQRPLLGYGYEAFWRGRTGPSLQIGAALHFLVLHAHNGFLEILLELGATGLALFLASWLRGAHKLWRTWRAGEVNRLLFPFAILVLIALYDLDENTLLLYNGIFWPLYVAALASIEQLLRDPHHAPPARPHEMLGLHARQAAATEQPAISAP